MTDAPVWQCSLGENEWCTADSPCFTCADLAHAYQRLYGLCPDDCRECKLASLQLSPQVGMETRGRVFGQPGWKDTNAYERGVPTDHTGMPYLNERGSVMGQKEFNAKRHMVDATMRHWHDKTQQSLHNLGSN